VVSFAALFFFFLKKFRFALNGGVVFPYLKGLAFVFSFFPLNFLALNFFFGFGGFVSQPNLLG